MLANKYIHQVVDDILNFSKTVQKYETKCCVYINKGNSEQS